MKKFLTMIAVAGGLLLSSCIRDEAVAPDNGSNNIPPNTLRVAVDVKQIGSETVSRATIAPEQGEDQLGNLYLLFFAPDPYKAGQFIDCVSVPGPLVMNSHLDIDLSTHPSLSISAAYSILAIANVSPDYLGDDVDGWMAGWRGKTEYQALTQALAYTQAGTQVFPDAILMNGRIAKAEDQAAITLTLVRNVARFDVHNNRGGDYDLISVSVWNAYPSSSVWGEGSSDYASSAARIRRFYGVSNTENLTGESDANGDFLGNIDGGLYVFENRVAAPKVNDKQTTCLIVGMRDRTADQVTYYRVNINPENSAQSLKRNNAYRLTIKGVNGPGQATEELAYTGMGNTLDYVINYWDLDDNGLIIQDGNSIMSLPAKTIRIGREGTTTSPVSHTIYTFSNLASYAPLTIASQTWEPADGSIVASLSGNTLKVEATPLGLGETLRQGVVVLTFAGLETSVTVIQSGATDTFLKVQLPDGGIPAYAPFPGIPSGPVLVQASGPWTAKLYMDGFSFDSAPLAVTTVTSASGLVMDNKLRIWTNSANTLPSMREAFVVVSLDSDPENYASVIRLAQKAAGGISVSPDQTRVTFNGQGTGLINLPGNDVSKFNVYPTDGTGIANWDYRFVMSGSIDDCARFTATAVKSTSDQQGNTITVKAVGANTAERAYSAILHIFLPGDQTKFIDITLVQQSQAIDISPASFTPIAVTGGETPLITPMADDGMPWSATVATMGLNGTRSLVNHAAYLVDDAGNVIAQNTSQPLSRKFRVVFPKVYYPNRDIPVTATVTLQLVGTPIVKTFTVTQNTLTSNGLNMTRMNTGWGTFSATADSFCAAYAAAVRALPGVSISGTTGVITAGTTYLHAGNNGMGSSFSVTPITGFMSTKDALTVIMADDNGSSNIGKVNTILGGRGYTVSSPGNNNNGVLNTDASVTSRKIFQFLTSKGATPVTSTTAFYVGGANTVATTIPASAVPVIVKTGNASQTLMAVDPVNRVIYIGEGEMFDGNQGGGRGTVLDNLMYYVGNAARYGSHFTDMLRDDLAVPAPWDDAWGANKGVEK